MRFIKNVALLLATSVLFSSCATMLNGKYQKVQVTTDPKTEILVNGEEPRTKKGMILLERNRQPKQITVKREGYKDENVTVMQANKSPLYVLSVVPFGILFYPIFYDMGPKAFNYEKEITVSNDTKLVSQKLEESKNIQLEKVSAEIPGNEMRYRYFKTYKEYIKKKDRTGTSPTGDEEGLVLENTIFANLLNDILKEQGYIDTTKRVLKSSYLNNLKINATAKKYVLHQVSSYVYSKFGGMMYAEISVDWDVLDFYGETIHSLTTSSISGEFAYMDSDEKSEAMNSALKDAMEYGLITFMQDEKVQELLIDRGEENRENEFEII
ncbi:MAG TPA: hypothetical protein VJ911_04710, partial [Cryomorphaceae bacterium]|nr:hypothetical protein [Cryomorphaceae bacterium]